MKRVNNQLKKMIGNERMNEGRKRIQYGPKRKKGARRREEGEGRGKICSLEEKKGVTKEGGRERANRGVTGRKGGGRQYE